VSAEISIVDGNASRTVPLDQDHLVTGSLVYIRKTDRVDISMVLQQGNGQPLREATNYVGRFAATPHDPGMVQRVGDLTEQNDKLKAEALRQAERARKAEKALEDLRRESQRKRLANQVPDSVK